MTALTVHNAAILTASAEVKTLTLAGKQVTLAVFRQVREKPLIAEDGSLNGKPWGVVNYHPDKCADTAPHLHVVWQDGVDLLRARVDLEIEFPRAIKSRHARAYFDAKAAAACSGDALASDVFGRAAYQEFEGIAVEIDLSAAASQTERCRERLNQYRSRLEAGDKSCEYWVFLGRGVPQRIWVSAPAAVRAAWHELDESLGLLSAEPLVVAEARVMAEIYSEVDRRRRHQAVRKDLADLPQLFIAI